MFQIKINGTAMPAPIQISDTDEIIWSSDTGRNSSGDMVGTVIASKRTFAITWGVLDYQQVALLRSKAVAGFFPLSITDDSGTETITCYRSTLNKEWLGIGARKRYYKNVSATFVQK